MTRLIWRSVRVPVLILIVFTLLLLIPQTRDGVVLGAVPIVRYLRHVVESTITLGQTIGTIPTIVSENGSLRARVNELQAVTITNSELKHENDLLRKELSLTNSDQAANLIPAQVISRAATVTQQSIEIDKGAQDGFLSGMAVISQGYLIGRVESVLTHSSRITLITSSQSLVPAVLQNSRSLGLLKGGADGLVVEEIPSDVTIAKDEAVVTSNSGNTIKGGIPVGAVKTVISGKSDVFQSARLSTPIDFSRLEVVFGVK